MFEPNLMGTAESINSDVKWEIAWSQYLFRYTQGQKNTLKSLVIHLPYPVRLEYLNLAITSDEEGLDDQLPRLWGIAGKTSAGRNKKDTPVLLCYYIENEGWKPVAVIDSSDLKYSVRKLGDVLDGMFGARTGQVRSRSAPSPDENSRNVISRGDGQLEWVLPTHQGTELRNSTASAAFY